jgi:hypothetical protein
MSRILLLLPLLLACYTYHPIPSTEPVAGTRVSAELTGEGARMLAPAIGPDVLHIEGVVLEADSARMDLSVRQVESLRGIQADWRGERVAVPRDAVAGLQQRRLSPGATGLVTGLGLAGLYALYRLFGGPGIFEGNDGGSGGGNR